MAVQPADGGVAALSVLRRRALPGVGLFGQCRPVAERIAAEQPREAVEPVVPVVIAGDAQHDALAIGRAEAEQGAVPRPDETPGNLLRRTGRIGRVATEDEQIAPGQPGPVRAALDERIREDHAGHRGAHVVVVGGVGDEVNPDVAAQPLGQRVAVRRPP